MRKWRVGTISMGVLLIATGLILLAGEIQGYNGAGLILRWWPAILIILGAEILVYIFVSREEQPRIKFDGLSIFIVIMIILISSAAYGTGVFLKSDFSGHFLGGMGFYKYETLITRDYEYDAEGVDKLQLRNSYGKVRIESYAGDKIRIESSIHIRNNDEEAARKLAEKLLEINAHKTLTISTNDAVLNGGSSYQGSLDYVVKVPKTLAYDIRNEGGSTTLAGLAGDVKIHGESGEVKVDGLGGNLQIKNSFGRIRVDDVAGIVKIESENGEIVYSNTQTVAHNVNLFSKTGSIQVYLPAAQEGTFDVSTENGEINTGGFDTEFNITGAPHTGALHSGPASDRAPTEEPALVPQDGLRQQIKQTIGTPNPTFTLRTEFGSIELKGR